MWECSSEVSWDKRAVQDRLFKLFLLLEDEELDICQFSVMDQEDACEDSENMFLDFVAWLEKRIVVSQEVDDLRREAEQVLTDSDFPISELPPIYDEYRPLDVMRAALGESCRPDCNLKEEQLKAVHELYWTMNHFIRKLRQVSLSRGCQVTSTELVQAPGVICQHLESTASLESPDFLHNHSSELSTSAAPGQCSYVGIKCRPCRWHHTSTGCRLALQCKFCHVCPRERRPNQKMRAAKRYWAAVREHDAQREAAMAEHFGKTYHKMKSLSCDATVSWPSEVVQASPNDQQMQQQATHGKRGQWFQPLTASGACNNHPAANSSQ